jgi:hypothetical protein
MLLPKQGASALLLAMLVVGGGAAAVSAQNGVITGTVTQASSGMPVTSAQIAICAASGSCSVAQRRRQYRHQSPCRRSVRTRCLK